MRPFKQVCHRWSLFLRCRRCVHCACCDWRCDRAVRFLLVNSLGELAPFRAGRRTRGALDQALHRLQALLSWHRRQRAYSSHRGSKRKSGRDAWTKRGHDQASSGTTRAKHAGQTIGKSAGQTIGKPSANHPIEGRQPSTPHVRARPARSRNSCRCKRPRGVQSKDHDCVLRTRRWGASV